MKKLLAAFCVAVVAVACGNPSAHADKKVSVEKISGDSTPWSFWHGRVDGVECIALYDDNGSNYNRGYNGLSCNWQPR